MANLDETKLENPVYELDSNKWKEEHVLIVNTGIKWR